MSRRWTPPELGPRGEGWVVLQVAVLATAVIAGVVGRPWPRDATDLRRLVAYVLMGAGAILALAGMRHLGPALTPYPRPGEGAGLREHGSFRLVRHPIYGGALLGSLGWSLATSPLALAPAALLAAVLWSKSLREEVWLAERYAGCAAYRGRVRRRFVPFLW